MKKILSRLTSGFWNLLTSAKSVKPSFAEEPHSLIQLNSNVKRHHGSKTIIFRYKKTILWKRKKGKISTFSGNRQIVN